MVGPAAKREAVAHLRNVLQMSERRACTLVAADRKMIRYRSRRPPDVELRTRLRDLANQRRRFGYRRLFILLREQGEPSGVNRIYRLYREEGLSKRKARRRAVGTRTPILVEAKVNVVNARWSLDFVHDQFAQGGASAFSTSWMTSRANVWRRSPTPRSQANGLHASLRLSSMRVASVR